MLKRHPRRGRKLARQQKKLREAKKWFNHLDFDRSGEISVDELKHPMVSMGFAHSVEEVQEMIDRVDADGSGEIGFHEFWEILNDSKNSAISKLYDALDSGALGDHDQLDLETLLSNFRRDVLFKALESRGWRQQNLTVREKLGFQKSIDAMFNAFLMEEAQAEYERQKRARELEMEKKLRLRKSKGRS